MPDEPLSRGPEGIPDRAKYLALVLGLYALAVGAIVGIVALIFSRPYIDVAVNLMPAILVCLVATIYHGLRHDLDS